MAGFVPTKTKRKDLDEVYDEFSEFSLNSPARKIRRLDAELPPIMEEEDPGVALPAEQPIPVEVVSSGMAEVNSPMVDVEPPLPLNEDRALVLYKPVENPFVLSPSSGNLSYRVHSNLVDGLKNQAFWPANPRAVRIEEVPDDYKAVAPDNSLAVIPWGSYAESGSGMRVEEPMEAEEDAGDASMEVEGEGQWAGNSGVGESLHPLPQHCLIPQPPQNNSTPIMWSWG